jgi:hypothetical protein
MNKGRKKLELAITGLALIIWAGCATGEDKREGTAGRPQPAVGTTFGTDTVPRVTGTAPPGDTAGVNARRGHNDQIGPTGRGPDPSHPEAPAY